MCVCVCVCLCVRVCVCVCSKKENAYLTFACKDAGRNINSELRKPAGSFHVIKILNAVWTREI